MGTKESKEAKEIVEAKEIKETKESVEKVKENAGGNLSVSADEKSRWDKRDKQRKRKERGNFVRKTKDIFKGIFKSPFSNIVHFIRVNIKADNILNRCEKIIDCCEDIQARESITEENNNREIIKKICTEIDVDSLEISGYNKKLSFLCNCIKSKDSEIIKNCSEEYDVYDEIEDDFFEQDDEECPDENDSDESVIVEEAYKEEIKADCEEIINLCKRIKKRNGYFLFESFHTWLDKKASKKVIVICSLSLVIYAINQNSDLSGWFENVAKKISFGDFNLNDSTKTLQDGLFLLSKVGLSFSVLFSLLMIAFRGFIEARKWFHRTYNNKEFSEEVTEKNEFDERLFHYLENDKSKKCLIVTGGWGIGKTYQISQFFDRYKSYRSVNNYTVSCFSIENREQLENLLSEERKVSDTSLEKKILEMLANIPLIDSLIYGAMDNLYSLDLLKKNDVIILEDVERVSPTEDMAKGLGIITGFANDLIERHDKKVILVCNKERFNINDYNDILYSKIACEEVEAAKQYRYVFRKIISDTINQYNKQSVSVDKQQIISDIEKNIESKSHDEIIISLLEKAHISNIRTLQKIISSFIVAYCKNQFRRIEVYDILYSIVLYQMAVEYNITISEKYSNCSFMELNIYEKSLHDNDNLRYVCCAFPTEYQWIGVDEVKRLTSSTKVKSVIDLEKSYIRKTDDDTKIRRWSNVSKMSELNSGEEENVFQLLNAYVRAVFLKFTEDRRKEILSKIRDEFVEVIKYNGTSKKYAAISEKEYVVKMYQFFYGYSEKYLQCLSLLEYDKQLELAEYTCSSIIRINNICNREAKRNSIIERTKANVEEIQRILKENDIDIKLIYDEQKIKEAHLQKSLNEKVQQNSEKYISEETSDELAEEIQESISMDSPMKNDSNDSANNEQMNSAQKAALESLTIERKNMQEQINNNSVEQESKQ